MYNIQFLRILFKEYSSDQTDARPTVCSHNTTVGVDVLGDPKKQTIIATKGGDYRNKIGGRGNPSPTTKIPKPHGSAVCSHNTIVGTGVLDGPKKQTITATKGGDYRNQIGGRRAPALRCKIKFRNETGRRGRRPLQGKNEKLKIWRSVRPTR